MKTMTDLVLESDGIFASVEFKFAGGESVSYWNVTGQDNHKLPILLFKAAMPIPASDERSAFALAQKVFESHVKPIAELSLAAGGITTAPDYESESLEGVFEVHAQNFERNLIDTNSGSDSLLTGGLYRIAKFLGVKKPVRSLAAFMGLPESTINRRLTRLRDLGLIAKRGGQPDA